MAARKRMWTPEMVRERIRVGMLLNRLTNHALGRIEMTPTQVSAAQTLLRKTLPDLASVNHTGGLDVHNVSELNRKGLEARIAALEAELAQAEAGMREGITEPTERSGSPDGIH